jgi:hypothetical protein
MEGFPYLDEMEGYQPLLGPFLSILFMGFVVLVGLNMFIVILSGKRQFQWSHHFRTILPVLL